MPLVVAVFTVLGTAERLFAFVRRALERPREERAERRTSTKDFWDAFYHLDRLSVATTNGGRMRHRLELERILLAAYADRQDDERATPCAPLERWS
jgi:hypothetical protein